MRTTSRTGASQGKFAAPAGRSRPEPGRARTVMLAVALLVLGGLLCPVQPVRAQVGPGNFEQVQQYIARTEEILHDAAEAVRQSESVRARQVLQEAEQLHQRSYQLLMEGHPLVAYKTSGRARQAALHAAQIARDELSFEERVRVRLERLQELHDSVLERAQEAQDERVLRFVREAERLFHQAKDQSAQRNFEVAFHLLESCESLLQRAARLLFEGGGAGRLEQELDRTAELIERTREHLGLDADRVSLDMLQRAEELLQQARQSLTRAEPLQTLRLARQARRLAGQAAAQGGTGPSAEAVREQITRWDERAAAVAEQIQQSGSKEARLLLERARLHRQKAGESLAAGNRELSLRQIVFAHDLLNEASELVR